LIARKREDDQPLVFKLFVDLLQASILVGETTLRGHIDDEHGVALQIRKLEDAAIGAECLIDGCFL
jgi:hypothetical protein